jgi:hypothetical protein
MGKRRVSIKKITAAASDTDSYWVGVLEWRVHNPWVSVRELKITVSVVQFRPWAPSPKFL